MQCFENFGGANARNTRLALDIKCNMGIAVMRLCGKLS